MNKRQSKKAAKKRAAINFHKIVAEYLMQKLPMQYVDAWLAQEGRMKVLPYTKVEGVRMEENFTVSAFWPPKEPA